MKRWVTAVALLVTACSQPVPVVSSVSSSPTAVSPSAAASPSPILPCGAAGRCLVLVTLRGSDRIVVRDITDIAHPSTVGKLGTVPAPRFRDGTLVTYADGTDMWGVPVGGSPARIGDPYPGIQAFAWSPDGKALVFNHGESSATSPTEVYLLKADSGHVALGTIPTLGGGGCETYESCTLPNWLDFQLRYSPDGTLISLVVNSFSASVFRVWRSDGVLIKNDDSRGWTMSAWSGDGLYFRGSSGVMVMRNGDVANFLPGVAWIKPSASPAGGTIVYSVRDSAGWSHTYVVDTTTGKARELNKARTGAVFLTSRYIWYQGERACVPSDNCGSSPATHPLSGKTFIYDLQDGTETESVITGVYDVWPHAA